MQELLVMIAGIPTYRGERSKLEAFVRQGDVVYGLAERLQLDELFAEAVVGRTDHNIRASTGIDSMATWYRARANLKKWFGGVGQPTQENANR